MSVVKTQNRASVGVTVCSFIRPLKIPNGIRPSYDANFKLMLINSAKKMNNCNAARKFIRVLETNM
jgi:hypothetical protein